MFDSVYGFVKFSCEYGRVIPRSVKGRGISPVSEGLQIRTWVIPLMGVYRRKSHFSFKKKNSLQEGYLIKGPFFLGHALLTTCIQGVSRL